jgi:hypothetical protein
MVELLNTKNFVMVELIDENFVSLVVVVVVDLLTLSLVEIEFVIYLELMIE